MLMFRTVRLTRFFACAWLTAICSQTAPALIIPEVEANDSKGAATMALGMFAGDMIVGNSTGSSTTTPGTTSADYFKVSTAPLPLGIYEHRLVITTAGTAGHTGTIRGVTVAGGVGGSVNGTPTAGSDPAIQTSSTTTSPARFNQWYGFGKGEMLFYRVAGGATTTADYAATLETRPIVPVSLGTFQAGPWDLTTFDLAKSPTTTGFSFTDTEVWLYDSSFATVAAWNNDDFFPASTTHPFHSELHLTLTPGTYFLALSQFNLANEIVADATSEAGPNDSIMDFPDSLVHSSSTATHGTPAVPVSLDFSVTDSVGTTIYDAAKPGPYGIYWATFTVVPEPTTLATFLIGAMICARGGIVGATRRRRGATR